MPAATMFQGADPRPVPRAWVAPGAVLLLVLAAPAFAQSTRAVATPAAVDAALQQPQADAEHVPALAPGPGSGDVVPNIFTPLDPELFGEELDENEVDAGDRAPVPAAPVATTAAVGDTAPAPSSAGAGTRGVLFRITLPAPEPPPVDADGEVMGAAVAAPASPAPADDATGMDAPVPPLPASYLLATIHFGQPSEQGIDYAALEQVLASVETFVNEADMDEAWKPDYDGYRWMPPEQALSRMIGKDAFAMASALLPKIRRAELERMKPWAVLALLEARGESVSDVTMDARLQQVAQASGKRVVHLESLEAQLRALDCVPAREHATVLAERLRTPWIMTQESSESMRHYRQRNLDAWLADVDRMDGLSEDAKAIEYRSRRCLLEERTAKWLPELDTLLRKGPCFIAVGAVHLAGIDGLVASLRRMGYTVEAEPL